MSVSFTPSNLLLRELRFLCSTPLWRGCGLRSKFRCVAVRPNDPWATLHCSSSNAGENQQLGQLVDVVTVLSLPVAGRGHRVLFPDNGRNFRRCGVPACISDKDRCAWDTLSSTWMFWMSTHPVPAKSYASCFSDYTHNTPRGDLHRCMSSVDCSASQLASSSGLSYSRP